MVTYKLFNGKFFVITAVCMVVVGLSSNSLSAQDASDTRRMYSDKLLRPFWRGDIVEWESVLFVRDVKTGEARASLLFPVQKVIAVRSSDGDITYHEGVDFRFSIGSPEIVIPPGSRIVTKTPQDLRRPAKSQKYQLTHRDGNGEILFGAKLEYHDMQTCVTYVKASRDWPVEMPVFDAQALPRTIQKLRSRDSISVVLLGDSISTGCNASGWAEGKPHQPPYSLLLQQHLEATYRSDVTLTNLSVSGTSTPWGLTMIDKVVEHEPDLVILAFGMNDSAGRSAEEYGKNTAEMISKIRKARPVAEFILVASMLGNRDWVLLKHDVFPKYRDQLAKLCQPGVALADMTSVWNEFLKRKQDHDLTGNGVNHPNDFGHRVYAQVISTLLIK
ncbi:MAG: SGNH/GDSL hydrolase family protein [Fuerstiella sp.]|jgi:lysophospholipase L1-like esterase|nr:SGNH/GDSL hydrolase family protein [Fuerstiella sp.]